MADSFRDDLDASGQSGFQACGRAHDVFIWIIYAPDRFDVLSGASVYPAPILPQRVCFLEGGDHGRFLSAGIRLFFIHDDLVR